MSGKGDMLEVPDREERGSWDGAHNQDRQFLKIFTYKKDIQFTCMKLTKDK